MTSLYDSAMALLTLGSAELAKLLAQGYRVTSPRKILNCTSRFSLGLSKFQPEQVPLCCSLIPLPCLFILTLRHEAKGSAIQQSTTFNQFITLCEFCRCCFSLVESIAHSNSGYFSSFMCKSLDCGWKPQNLQRRTCRLHTEMPSLCANHCNILKHTSLFPVLFNAVNLKKCHTLALSGCIWWRHCMSVSVAVHCSVKKRNKAELC